MSFNNLVKDARANLVSNSQRNPIVLFDTISNIVTPATPAVPIFSSEECNKFLSFFVGKINDIRIEHSPHLPQPIPCSLAYNLGEYLSDNTPRSH